MTDSDEGEEEQHEEKTQMGGFTQADFRTMLTAPKEPKRKNQPQRREQDEPTEEEDEKKAKKRFFKSVLVPALGSFAFTTVESCNIGPRNCRPHSAQSERCSRRLRWRPASFPTVIVRRKGAKGRIRIMSRSTQKR